MQIRSYKGTFSELSEELQYSSQGLIGNTFHKEQMLANLMLPKEDEQTIQELKKLKI